MRDSHPSPIFTAARLSSLPIRIRIALAIASRRARRDGAAVLPHAGPLRLIQFRSAAVGAASLIAGVILGGIARLGARVQRVFAVIQKVSVCGSLHVDQSDLGKFADVRKAFGVLRNA